MSWAVVAVAGAGVQATVGAYRYFHAKSQAKKNIRPTYGTMGIDTAQQNLSTLENTFGIPDSVLNSYYLNAGQAGTAGINAINANGGNANQIANLVYGQQKNYQDVLNLDAMQKKQDITGINNARLELLNQKDKRFSLDQLNPYKDKAQALAAEQAAGFTMIGNGLNSASSAVAGIATGKLADQYKQGDSTLTTPGEGVNTNQIYRNLSGNLPQLNLPQSYSSTQMQNGGYNPAYNPYGQMNNGQMNWNQQQQPFNLNTYNPYMQNLWNNGYSLNF